MTLSEGLRGALPYIVLAAIIGSTIGMAVLPDAKERWTSDNSQIARLLCRLSQDRDDPPEKACRAEP